MKYQICHDYFNLINTFSENNKTFSKKARDKEKQRKSVDFVLKLASNTFVIC